MLDNISTDVIAKLVLNNESEADVYHPKSASLTGATCKGQFKCGGIRCGECPFSNENDANKEMSMGKLRDELATRESTESHKGGGGVVSNGFGITLEDGDYSLNKVDSAVFHPKHYEVIDGLEAIEIIARSMTVEQFKGYCLGNIIKYRMRLGSKDAVEQDLKKAQNYKDIFEKHKGLCHDASK